LMRRPLGAQRVILVLGHLCLAVAAVAVADDSWASGPLTNVPSGWSYRFGGNIHYWSGSYSDSQTGAKVEFQIADVASFNDLCAGGSEVSVTMGYLEGVKFCAEEIGDARRWAISTLKGYYPDYVSGSKSWRSMQDDLPAMGSSIIGISFIVDDSVWSFTSTYCSAEERSRLLDLLMDKMRIDLHPHFERPGS
jgi:hypothetical protein